VIPINAFLLFTNPILGVLIISLLYSVYSKRPLGNLMFNCIFINGAINSILKSIFKVPLHISLNNTCWWSFPSGHMQYGIVLWGMLWVNSNFNLKLLGGFIVLLMLSAFAINYNHYHTYFEMLGAVPPAVGILSIYYVMYKKNLSLINLNIISIILQAVVIFNIESPCIGYKLNWMYLNLGANIGLLITLFFHKHETEKYQLQTTIKNIKFNRLKLLLMLTSLCIFWYIITVFRTIDGNFICGIFLPLVLFFISKLRNP
jgi:hypothetical protein